MSVAFSRWLSLVTSQVFEGFGKYPKSGPSAESWFYQPLSRSIEPQAAELSAYQICLHMPSSFLMRGIVARPYIAMAKGSPWVVPSCDGMTSPSMKRSMLDLYELMSIVAMVGQRRRMFCRATWRLMQLKAFVASTSSTASTLSDSIADLVAWTAASMPDIWPPHSWRQPAAFWMSEAAMNSTALVMIRRAVSPIPIGRAPGFLLRAMRRHARSGATGDGWTYEEHSLHVTDARAVQRSLEAPLWLVHKRLHSPSSR